MGKMLNFLIVTASVVFSTKGQTQDFCCPLKQVTTMTSWSCRPWLCLNCHRKKKNHSHLNHRQSKVSGPNGDLSGVYRLHPRAPGGHFPEDCKDSCVYRWLHDGSEVAKFEIVSCPLILTIGSLCRSSSLSIIISTERRVQQGTIRRNRVGKG